MKGKNEFTKNETETIKSLLINVRQSDHKTQKLLRNELRDVHSFYISDFTNSKKGFSVEDFENLLIVKRIVMKP